MVKKERKKKWVEKVEEAKKCYQRCYQNPAFAREFYKNLFFLNPKLTSHFKKTDWPHLEKALMHGLDHLFNFLDQEDKEHEYHRKQLIRIALSHSKANLDIHPHDYYYWIDGVILTMKKMDPKWYDDLEYYLRECLFFPISFMITFYHDSKFAK